MERRRKYRYTLFFMNPETLDRKTTSRRAHWFLFRRKRFHRRGALYRTTHLYNVDPKRAREVNKKKLRKVRFDCFDASTGVYPKPIRRNVKMTDMRRKSIGYVDNVRPRRAKKEFDPYIRKRGKRKKAPGRAA